jgi:hypothetical protein
MSAGPVRERTGRTTRRRGKRKRCNTPAPQFDAGQHSLDELASRRRGLLIAVGVIIAALAALALKIRQG